MQSKFIISPGFFNRDSGKTARDKNLEILALSSDQAQRKLQNISSKDFYTFENLMMLFKQADPINDAYKYTATTPVIRLLSLVNKSKHKLTEDELQEIFNRFYLYPSQLVSVLKYYPKLAKQLPPNLLLVYAESSAILAEYIMNNKDLRNKIKTRQQNNLIDYQAIYEKLVRNNCHSLWWADRAGAIRKETSLDLFLTSWDNFRTLKWRCPRYVEKVTKQNVASLFALADTKEKFIDVFYYLSSHPTTIAVLKEFLKEGNFLKHTTFLMTCENRGYDFLSRYPSLVQALYEKNPVNFAESIREISDFKRKLEFLKINNHWLTAEHLIYISETLAKREDRVMFLKQRFVRDKLRFGIDHMITTNNPITNKDTALIIRALKQRDVRETVDLTRKRRKDNTDYLNNLVQRMSSEEPCYNAEIAKTVACDSKLLGRIQYGPWLSDPHIQASYKIRQEIKQNRGLFSSGKSEFIKLFIAQTNHFDARSITEETKAICLIIADDPDLFARLTSAYIGKRRFFGLLGPSKHEMTERRQKLETFSEHFKAKFNPTFQLVATQQVVEDAIKLLEQFQADPPIRFFHSAAAAAASKTIPAAPLSSQQVLHSSTSTSASINDKLQSSLSASEMPHNLLESNGQTLAVVRPTTSTIVDTTNHDSAASSSPRSIVNRLSPSCSASSFGSEVQSVGSTIGSLTEALPCISQHHVILEKSGRIVDCSTELSPNNFSAVLSLGKPDKKTQELIYKNNPGLVKIRYEGSFIVGKEVITDELRNYWFLYKGMFDEKASNGALLAVDLNVILKVNTPETHEWFKTFFNAHASNKAYVKEQFRLLTQERNNTSEVALFSGLAGDENFVSENLNSMLKLFDQNGKTLPTINMAFAELFERNHFLAVMFLDCVDQHIVSNNINLFLPLLENSNITLASTKLLKLYRTHNEQAIRSILSSSRYCSEIKTSIRDSISESDLNIAINCIFSLNSTFHSDFQTAKSIISLFNYEKKSERLSKEFRSLDFDNLLQKPALIAAILEDVSQCHAVFVENQAPGVIKQRLQTLYSLGNETITRALFKLRHADGFKLELLTSGELLDLYKKNSIFADLICNDTNWFGTFERELLGDEREKYRFKFLQKADAKNVAHYFANIHEHTWLKTPPYLMILLSSNPHFARHVVMDGRIRNQLNLNHDHFIFAFYQFLNKPEALRNFLSAYDKAFVGEVLLSAINNGDLNRIQLLLNGKIPTDAYIDIAFNKIRPLQLEEELVWARSKDASATVDLIFAHLFPGRVREAKAKSSVFLASKTSTIQEDVDITSLAANHLENPLYCFTNLTLLKQLARDPNTIIAMAITAGFGLHNHEVAKILSDIEPIASDDSLKTLRNSLLTKANSFSATESAKESRVAFFRSSEQSQTMTAAQSSPQGLDLHSRVQVL